jgi:heme exporter protein A
MSGYEDVQCQQMSAGQKRRVNLARLFMFAQKNYAGSVWILDEPFTAIDVDGVQKLEQKIAEYVEQGGAAILTTHQTLGIKNLDVLNLDAWGT